MSNFYSEAQLRRFQTALYLVPYDQRQALQWLYGRSLSRGEFVQHLDAPPSNISPSQQAALLKLRGALCELEHLEAERAERLRRSEQQVLGAPMFENVFLDVEDALLKMDPSEWRATFRDNWSDNRWLNTPGTIYCGQTDNCGTGHPEASYNICEDAHGYEIIFRQPVNQHELLEVIQAAACDPFGGYGCDGNRHWNREALREWWARHDELKQEIKRMKASRGWIPEAYDAWLSYIDGDALLYLRVYACFLEMGRVPRQGEALPEL